MGVGVNSKIAFSVDRYMLDNYGYARFGILPADRPSLFLNFVENPSPNNHGVTLTTTRASATATYFDANRVLQTALADTPRFNHDNVTGQSLGLLVEQASTNLMLRSRDLTNAAWNVQTNVTVAVDQTGIDATANSASSVLATAGDAVITQAITSASAARVFTAYVKRLVGTGTISITLDGGGTYTDVTSQLNSAYFVRVRAAQTVTNPAVGFKITTSGDSIAVDYCQCESNTIETSPILSVAGQGARQPDNIVISSLTPWHNQAAGSFYSEALSSNGVQAVNQYILITDDTGANERTILFRGTTRLSSWFLSDGGVTQFNLNVGTWADNTTARNFGAYSLNDSAQSFAGAAIQTDTGCTMPTPTNMKLGVSQAASSHLNGHIKRIAYWSRRMPNAMLVTMATA